MNEHPTPPTDSGHDTIPASIPDDPTREKVKNTETPQEALSSLLSYAEFFQEILKRKAAPFEEFSTEDIAALSTHFVKLLTALDALHTRRPVHPKIPVLELTAIINILTRKQQALTEDKYEGVTGHLRNILNVLEKYSRLT